MANEPVDKANSMLQSVTRMVDAAVNDGAGYDNLINVLSLICLVSVLSRGTSQPAQATPAGNANTLQKLIGDLAKGEGGLGPETLVSLLPLLNSPQVKSKLNPATIGAVMGLLNSMGDKGDKAEKGEKSGREDAANKGDRSGDRADKAEDSPETGRIVTPTAATVTCREAAGGMAGGPEDADIDRKGLGRYLNWKNNF